jgi:sulfite reductase alpha subunit-like flavoprotein
LHFATFGLGDSSYVKYNYAAKMLHNRLVQLGATPIVRRGDGDDQHAFGLYGDLFPWMKLLADALSEIFPSMRGINIDEIPQELPPPRSRLIIDQVDASTPIVLQFPGASAVRLVSNTRITASEWDQDVRHVVFDTTGSNLSYSPGDVVCTLRFSSFLLLLWTADAHRMFRDTTKKLK